MIYIYIHILTGATKALTHPSITTRTTDQANPAQDTKHILPDALTSSNIHFNLKLPHSFLCKEDMYILLELEDNQLSHLLWHFVTSRFLKVQVLITAACTYGVWILADRIVLVICQSSLHWLSQGPTNTQLHVRFYAGEKWVTMEKALEPLRSLSLEPRAVCPFGFCRETPQRHNTWMDPSVPNVWEFFRSWDGMYVFYAKIRKIVATTLLGRMDILIFHEFHDNMIIR